MSTTQPASRLHEPPGGFLGPSASSRYVPESLRAFARRWLAADGLRYPAYAGACRDLRAALGRTSASCAATCDDAARVARHRSASALERAAAATGQRPGGVLQSLVQPSQGAASLSSTGATPATRASAKKRASPPARRARRGLAGVRRALRRRSSGARPGVTAGEIVALRFDPINLPGLIGLGELALCAAPPRLGDGRVQVAAAGDSSSASPLREFVTRRPCPLRRRRCGR